METKIPTEDNLDEFTKDVVKSRKFREVAAAPSRDRNKLQTDDGDNAKFLSNALAVAQLGRTPINIHSVPETRQRINEYFSTCVANDVKPTVAGMALAFGITRARLWERANGRGHTPLEKEIQDEYQKAYALINMLMEDYMQNGKINPVAGIFLMKNNLGYTDTQEYVLTPQIGNARTPEELISEAQMLPDSTDIDA